MKKVLIAGASSGIGFSLAKRLIDEHYGVISLSRNRPTLAVLEHHAHDLLTDKALPVLLHPLDGLVFCPGSILLKPFKNLKISDFRNDLEINVLAAVKVIQQYLGNLLSSGSASVILFSSIAARLGMPYHASIAASKGAIESMARSLAAELAPNIRVNVISPSLVKTALSARLTDTEMKINVAARRHPLNKIGEPGDIADLAVFLLSEQASWITGQTIHIDGGMSTLKI